MPQDHFLYDEASFDGLAEANIIGDEQVDPRHRKSPDNWVELVFVYLNAAAERGLQGFVVGLGDCPPANGVEKGSQALGIIERVRVWKGRILVNSGSRFQLPDDLKLFTYAVVFDGRELDQVA
jgi:hypothetical protein